MKCDKTETQIIHKNLVFSNIIAIHFCVYNTETKVKTQTDCYSLRKAKHWDILKSHNDGARTNKTSTFSQNEL
jgi:hypothetical protein